MERKLEKLKTVLESLREFSRTVSHFVEILAKFVKRNFWISLLVRYFQCFTVYIIKRYLALVNRSIE